MRALVASGAGRYADPWHPFARTTPLLVSLLADAGFVVSVDDDVDHAVTQLDAFDLLVVNAGDPWRGGGSAAPQASTDALATALERGIGVLAMHAAVSSLRDYPDWAPAVGAMWVPSLSFHPPAGLTRIEGGVLPDDDGPIRDFEVFDEQYCRLQQIGRSETVAHHVHDGVRSPAAWVREYGRSRVAVDVLGHDERSYASAGHRRMLTRLIRWTVAPRRADGVSA